MCPSSIADHGLPGSQHCALCYVQYRQDSAPKWQYQDDTGCRQMIQDVVAHAAHAILTFSTRKCVTFDFEQQQNTILCVKQYLQLKHNQFNHS